MSRIGGEIPAKRDSELLIAFIPAGAEFGFPVARLRAPGKSRGKSRGTSPRASFRSTRRSPLAEFILHPAVQASLMSAKRTRHTRLPFTRTSSDAKARDSFIASIWLTFNPGSREKGYRVNVASRELSV